MRHTLTLSLIIIALVLLLAAAAAYITTSSSSQIRYVDAPIGGGHRIGLMAIPCTPDAPGSIVIGYDLFISSRRPPPGFLLPMSPRCP